MMLEFHKLALMVGFACWAVTNAAGIQEGKCRYVRPVQINLQLLEGPWYAVRRAIAEPFREQNSDCEFQKLYFAKNQYGTHLRFNRTNCENSQCEWTLIYAYKMPRARGSTAAFDIDFVGHGPTSKTPTFFILHLDDWFAVMYYCLKFGNLKMEMAWILSRERFPNPYDVDKVERKIFPFGIDVEMVNISQDKCPKHVIDYKDEFRRRLITLTADVNRVGSSSEQEFADLKYAKFLKCMKKAVVYQEIQKCIQLSYKED